MIADSDRAQNLNTFDGHGAVHYNLCKLHTPYFRIPPFRKEYPLGTQHSLLLFTGCAAGPGAPPTATTHMHAKHGCTVATAVPARVPCHAPHLDTRACAHAPSHEATLSQHNFSQCSRCQCHRDQTARIISKLATAAVIGGSVTVTFSS